MEAASPALTQRASFNFEDSYGIMGADFPALELMALYHLFTTLATQMCTQLNKQLL